LSFFETAVSSILDSCHAAHGVTSLERLEFDI